MIAVLCSHSSSHLFCRDLIRLWRAMVFITDWHNVNHFFSRFDRRYTLLVSLTVSCVISAGATFAAEEQESNTSQAPAYTSSLVFPYDRNHNHAPGIVEYPNGDLLVSWYRGSGERTADDVAIYGAHRRRGSDQWSKAFVMADSELMGIVYHQLPSEPGLRKHRRTSLAKERYHLVKAR